MKVAQADEVKEGSPALRETGSKCISSRSFRTADIRQILTSRMLSDVPISAQSDQICPERRCCKQEAFLLSRVGFCFQPDDQCYQQKRDTEGQHLPLTLYSQRQTCRQGQSDKNRRDHPRFSESHPDTKMQQDHQKVAGIIACHCIQDLKSIGGGADTVAQDRCTGHTEHPGPKCGF